MDFTPPFPPLNTTREPGLCPRSGMVEPSAEVDHEDGWVLDPAGLLARPQGRATHHSSSGAIAEPPHRPQERALFSSEAVGSELCLDPSSAVASPQPKGRALFSPEANRSELCLDRSAGAGPLTPKERALISSEAAWSELCLDLAAAAGRQGLLLKHQPTMTTNPPPRRSGRAADPPDYLRRSSPPTADSTLRSSSLDLNSPDSYFYRAQRLFYDDPRPSAAPRSNEMDRRTPASDLSRNIDGFARQECSTANSSPLVPAYPASDHRLARHHRAPSAASLPEGSAPDHLPPRHVSAAARDTTTTPATFPLPRLASSAAAPTAPVCAPSPVCPQDSAPTTPLTASEVDRSAVSGRRPSAFSPRQSPVFLPPPPASPVSEERNRYGRPSPTYPAQESAPGPRVAPGRLSEVASTHHYPSDASLSPLPVSARRMQAPSTDHVTTTDQYDPRQSPLGGRTRLAPRTRSAMDERSPAPDEPAYYGTRQVAGLLRTPEELLQDQHRLVAIATRSAEITRSPRNNYPHHRPEELLQDQRRLVAIATRSAEIPRSLRSPQDYYIHAEEPQLDQHREIAWATRQTAEFTRSPLPPVPVEPFHHRRDVINNPVPLRRSSSMIDVHYSTANQYQQHVRPRSDLADPRRANSQQGPYPPQRQEHSTRQLQPNDGHVTPSNAHVTGLPWPQGTQPNPVERVAHDTDRRSTTSASPDADAGALVSPAALQALMAAILNQLQSPSTTHHAPNGSAQETTSAPVPRRVPSPQTFPSTSTFSLGLQDESRGLPPSDADSQETGHRILNVGRGVTQRAMPQTNTDKNHFTASGSLLTQLGLHTEGEYSFSEIVKMLMQAESVKIDPKSKHYTSMHAMDGPTFTGNVPPFPSFVEQYEARRRLTQWSDWEATGALIATLRGDAKDMFDGWANAMADTGPPLAERSYKAILKALAMRYWNRDARAIAKTTFLQLTQREDESWIQYLARYNQFRQGLSLSFSEERTPLYSLNSIALTAMVANSTLPTRLLLGELTDQDARYAAKQAREPPPKQTVTFLPPEPTTVARVYSSNPPNDRLTNASSFGPVRGVDKERLSRDQESAKRWEDRRPRQRSSRDSNGRGQSQQPFYDWATHKCEFCGMVGHGIKRCRTFNSFLRDQTTATTSQEILSNAFKTYKDLSKNAKSDAATPMAKSEDQQKN